MSKHGAMNRIYRVVWNEALGVWQAVSEIGKGRKKIKTRRVVIATPELAGLLKQLHPARIGLTLGSILLVSQSVYAASLPQNGVVTSGAGSINQANANTLNITQTTDRMAIDWQSFSVGQGNTVNFIQPSASAIALNRVVGNDVSNIQGAINANGQVFLINPNGVLFSTTAQVNVGGLVASTRNITNAQFDAGDYRFEGNSSSAIINQGNIKVADGGYVVMIAAKIDNAGSITANQGTVAMGAGNLVTLDMGGPVKLKVEQGNIDALIKNGGAIQAEGGHILLTAKAAGDLAASVINNSGKIEASSISEVGGQIVLLGDDITNSGTLAANGATGGGEVLIGGDWQGANADLYPQATKVALTETSEVSADATEKGDGGKVVAWSDITNAESVTSVKGSITAKGGAQGGNGGKVETSGYVLDIEKLDVSTAADKGETGQWLIDPYNITIGSGASGTGFSNPYTPSTDSVISASTVNSALANNNVTISTGLVDGNSAGNITVSAALNWSAATSLTLRAANAIAINADVTHTGTGGLVLRSRAGSVSGAGTLNLGSASSAGSNLTVAQGTTVANNINLTGYTNFKFAAIEKITVDALIVGGGGGGGADGGGGGAGGAVTAKWWTDLTAPTQTFSFTVGSGGAGGVYQQGDGGAGGQSSLTFNGTTTTVAGGTGGKSGPVGSSSSATNGTSLGSGGIASTNIGTVGGRGGDGYGWWVDNNTYGGGGGGGVYGQSGSTLGGVSGGLGGGGIGATNYGNNSATSGFAGVFATGGGGGGGSAGQTSGERTSGGAGGSGVVKFVITDGSTGEKATKTFTSNGSFDVKTYNTGRGGATFSGVISGTGKLTVDAGSGSVMAFNGANTYTADTFIKTGNLIANSTTALGSNTGLELANTTGAGLQLNRAINLGSLSGGGTMGGNISLASGATLSTGALNADTSYAGVISGAGGLTKTGSGTQTLTNNSTYTGATTINQGTLVLQNNAPTSATSGFSGVGALVIESASDSFSSAFSNSGWTFGSDLGGLRIGKTTNTQAINIDNAISIAGPISLNGGNLALNKAVTTTNNTLSLKSSGTITQSNLQADAITANSLLLSGGDVTLNNVYNNINTLAANGVSGLAYTNLDALTIGTVSSTNGVSATGVVNIATQTENLTLAKSVATTNSSATALTLNAGKGAGAGSVTGGNLIVTNDSTVTVGAGGTAKLFTGSILGSTGLADMTGLGVGSGRFRYYSDETTTNFTNSGTTALTSGLNAIFRERPVVTIAVADQSITYGDALSSTGTVNTTVKSADGNSDVALMGTTVLGDSTDYVPVTPANSTSGNIKAGTHTITEVGLASLGYNATVTNGTLTVGTKTLTVDGLTIADKTYDGTVNATTSTAGTLAGLVTNDLVTLSTVATFSSKDVEATKKVNLDYTLDGVDKDNYTLSDQTDVATDAKVNAKTVTLSATKNYDGTTDLSGWVQLGGFVGSETLTFSGATASDKHVATAGKYVNAITLENGINDGLASNYALPTLNAANAPVTINAVTLMPTLTNTGVTKVYDGTTKAPVSATPTWSFNGLVEGDSAAALTYSGAAYNSKDVATADQITVTGLAIDGISGSNGSLASDYVLDGTSKSVSATITPAALTISANNDARFFSQTDTPGYAGTSFTGFVNGETTSVLDIAGLTISRSDSSNNAAGTYTLTPTGATASHGNYAITYQNGTYTIVPAGQLLVKVSNLSRTYGTAVDYSIGSAAYLASDNSTINTVLLTDNSNSFSGDGVSFDVSAIGSSTSTAGKINVGSYQLGGSVTSGNSSNFSNNLVVVGALDVTQKSISASASGVSKTYDGTTDMTGVTLGLSTLETNDVVTVNGMGAFAQKNVGTNLGYTVSNLSLSGADANNYYLSGGTLFTGNDGEITPKTLTLNNIVASDKVYDGLTNTTVSADLAGLVETDSGAVAVAIGATFADKNVGTNKAVSINSVTLSGSEAENYSIASTATAQTANISRLNSVTWVGGANGNWFDPANWAGGAIPDLANVANVVIPSGVIVNFDTSTATGGAQTGAVEVDALGTNGTLIQTNGNLNIGAGGTTLFSYVQNGGTFTNAGSTTLSNFNQTDGSFSSTGDFTATNFSQSGGSTTLGADLTVNSEFTQGSSGSVTVSGDSTITDSSGGMVVGNLSTQGNTTITSNGGAISQANGTTLIANGTTSLTARNGGTAADISLNGANNNFVGEVSANGANITLVDGVGDLVLADVTASAKLDARATDNVLLNGALNVDSIELLATNGHITQGTNSTLVVATGETDLSAAGAIRLDKANDFNGAVNIANATDVVLNDTNALELGAIAMSGALDVVAQNNISQKSNTGIVSGGQVDFASTAGNVVLDSATNNFGGRFDASGQQVALTNYTQPLSLGDIVAQTALNIVTNNKAITQAPNTTIKSNGTSAMDAGSSSIALTNTGNDYGAITLNAAQVTRAETLSEAAARLSADEAARLAAEEVKRDAIANAQQQAAMAESATKTTQAVTNVNVEQLIQLVANAPLTSTDFNGVSTTSSGDFNLVFVSTDTLSATLEEKGILDVNLDDISSLMRFLEANNLLEQGRLVVVNNGIRLPFLLTQQDVNI